ncbi:MAG: CvpA family protein [Flavobacteriales bacterium]|nr:CvpA family protein [Flavobacteriales bacterium]
MNFIDIIAVIGLSYAIWKGFFKGFIIELFTFLALFIGLYAGIHFSEYASNILIENFDIENEYVPTISFTIVFLIVGAMVFFGGKAIEKVVNIVQLSLLNKLLGVLLSLAKMIFILGAIILLVESYDEKGDILSDKAKNDSVFYSPIKSCVSMAIPAFEDSTLFLKNTLINGVEIDENTLTEEE